MSSATTTLLGSAQVAVIRCGGTEENACDQMVPTLFHIACVDTGVIRWVNADLVSKIALSD